MGRDFNINAYMYKALFIFLKPYIKNLFTKSQEKV